MPKIIYTPEGGSKQVWNFDPERPDWDVAYATEKATGWPWAEFADRLGKGSFIALQALIWTLRKRQERNLDISSVQVTFDDIEIEEDEPAPAVDEEPESGKA
jgi:hypothetical protein